MKIAEESLRLAGEVRSTCSEQGLDLLLIGAVAMAAHGYPRHTEDIDFAVAVEPRRLAEVARALSALGGSSELSMPDAQDPLGGVLTYRREGAAPIQIVNFDNSPAGGFPRLVKDALARSSPDAVEIGKLPTLEDLILFKLYAGGPKSQLDILELLARTRVDLDELRAQAAVYRMSRELAAVLRLVGM